ncbi:Centrosomal protein of 41 kDa, partial [Eschrichtius robustus]|nr:Centrosomal protein of 41 kDa [Eschrichtius robustus]
MDSGSPPSGPGVISGVGELDLDKGLVKKVEPSTKDKPYPDCPFLLLDVRDRDSYQQCHIVGAYSYPIATLSRTMNPYSNDILEYKNAHGKIIILYDDDERLASQAATTMCERGFENLFMLSGGLKVLAQKFPEGLITGSLPASCQQTLPPASARKRSGPKVPPPAAENKWRFTPEDLKKIEYYLEEDQGPADSTSRLNQGNASGRNSKVPGARSGQNLPAGGPASHQNPRSLGSGHLQGKPWNSSPTSNPGRIFTKTRGMTGSSVLPALQPEKLSLGVQTIRNFQPPPAVDPLAEELFAQHPMQAPSSVWKPVPVSITQLRFSSSSHMCSTLSSLDVFLEPAQVMLCAQLPSRASPAHCSGLG